MTGMAYMWACDAGVDILDTAMSPISGGTGEPPTESIVAALKETEYDTGYDLKELMEIRRYFIEVWNKYRHLHRINALKVDPEVTLHQIPGGMLSNLIFQLEEQGAGDKYFQVLDETARVREELGYPPLVTPTSQVVGVQAVMNVLFGRYKNVPQETKDYLRGKYGKPPGDIKKEIFERVLGPNYKDEIIDCRPADLLEPMWDKRKEELEAKEKELDKKLIKKEEDIMTYAIYPQVGLKFLSGNAKPEFTSDELPLPITHPFSHSMIRAQFPELSKEEVSNFGKPVAPRQVAPVVPTEYNIEVNGEPFEVKMEPVGGFITIQGEGVDGAVANIPGAGGSGSCKPPADTMGAVKSSMQGTIIKVKANKGDEVEEGDIVAVIEAMKMENEIPSPHCGKVEDIFIKDGDTVNPGEVIMVIK
jgi:pyruvate carboxylase subunit B